VTAERELAAFYDAVFRRYGPKEGRKAAQDWIEEVETMDWPADGALPNWRHATNVAAIALPPESPAILRAYAGQPTSCPHLTRMMVNAELFRSHWD
jgi:hypothetical protein